MSKFKIKMKKSIFTLLCLLSIFACKKEDPELEPAPTTDTYAPVITLNGKQNDTVLVLTSYIDPGATASDDRDGNITSKIVVTGTVISGNPGTINTLTYNVSDQAGNKATPVIRTVYVKPGTAYILPSTYTVACNSTTQNPGVDPTLTENTTYTSSIQLSGQTYTMLSMTALNIGPLTTNTGIFGVNAFTFSLNGSPVNAPAQSFAYCTGTISPSKTTFTIDTKYYETMYPNMFYEVRNIFTKQ